MEMQGAKPVKSLARETTLGVSQAAAALSPSLPHLMVLVWMGKGMARDWGTGGIQLVAAGQIQPALTVAGAPAHATLQVVGVPPGYLLV